MLALAGLELSYAATWIGHAASTFGWCVVAWSVASSGPELPTMLPAAVAAAARAAWDPAPAGLVEVELVDGVLAVVDEEDEELPQSGEREQHAGEQAEGPQPHGGHRAGLAPSGRW